MPEQDKSVVMETVTKKNEILTSALPGWSVYYKF